ncbi:uncharacterized protein LOC118557511 [Fundulus heteroclitus]|uniref:uncharacterized protein LOC118557511 n=1 Tax=Fundulus heteroclitus TaxID=8078 RepID=UPI00165B2C2A|nr:uncharacterized protein LOC118557511 [Fundulus heteroclitus]
MDWIQWYKQSAGDSLQLILMLRKNTDPIYGPGYSSSSYKTTYENKTSNLTILKTDAENEGMYHCAHTNWLESTWSGTYLSIKGKTQKTSNIVVQQPAVSHSAYPGDLVSLKCSLLTDSDQKSCSGEPDVFWIRSGSDKSYPDSIYIDGERSSYCEKRADIQQRCVYNFSKNVNASDAGTYYCAVATCGEILFGIGSNLNIQESSLSPLDTITIICLLSTVLAISLAVILVLICLINKNKCEHCRGNIR